MLWVSRLRSTDEMEYHTKMSSKLHYWKLSISIEVVLLLLWMEIMTHMFRPPTRSAGPSVEWPWPIGRVSVQNRWNLCCRGKFVVAVACAGPKRHQFLLNNNAICWLVFSPLCENSRSRHWLEVDGVVNSDDFRTGMLWLSRLRSTDEMEYETKMSSKWH